jgi:PAS domain S-box-containing protein
LRIENLGAEELLGSDEGASTPSGEGQASAEAERIAAILESISDGLLALDREWRFSYVNRSAEVLLCTGGKELIGREIRAVLPDFAAPEIAPKLEEVMAGREPVQFRAWFPSLQLWLALNVNPSRDGLSISLRDVTERYRTQHAERLLAEAGRILAESLDYEATLPRVARVLVSGLVDVCSIDLVENGRILPLVVVTKDAEKEEAIGALRRLRRQRRVPLEPVGELRAGKPFYLPEVTEGALCAVIPNPEERRLVMGMELASLMLVPLVARGRLLGVLTVSTARGSRRLDPADLALVEELARRVAFVIDNAQLYEAALAASRAKSDFLAVVSHELRTPLNAIAACADLLEAEVVGPLNERQREQIERIEANADRLAHLINAILTFSRTESEQEKVRVEIVELASLCHDAVAAIVPQATAKGLRIRAELPEKTLAVRTDPLVVQRILLNLLGNAVHFTDEGEILLRGSVEGEMLILEVQDTGIGIPAESLELIFEPFWQLEGGLTRRTGGTGLGLPIARRLIRLLGGDIVARSEVGQGSTFTVRLPNAVPMRMGETVAA